MKQQKGATLITVLVILIVITLLGTIAVKMGIVGLKIATNSQVNALLLENSDSALFNIENPAEVERQLALDGMFAYFNSSANANDELVFCYRASENSFFKLSKASAITEDGSTTKIGVDGFCKANQFAMGRSAVLSQVYLTKSSTASAPFSSVPKGTSLGQSNVPATTNNIGATVISVLPSFAGATTTQIENCFKQRASAVGACFDGLGIPYNMQHSDYVVGGQPKLVS
ncbi:MULTISPECIES: pilus assembly PilX family protein [Acinetobacter]|jgi:competence protein ComGC|uniref:pilus assembly PilX family protein n=1 Tax=Acinetobacter TaxID=469 RepID=UPI0005B45184|nr:MULTISPECIES: pilus assembly protein PilX [Acinetobacter]MBY3626587.1 pilus assembly protein PilX [Acinetobacter sp. CUI P1]MDA3501756.1 pilus assembly protein PilX [Acinetobacter sp. AOR34_HL]